MAGSSNKQQCSFQYEGKTIRGHIVSSTSIQPHFYWFMFDDDAVIRQYGDSIAFKVERGKLVPLYHLTAAAFVAAVQDCLEKALALCDKINN